MPGDVNSSSDARVSIDRNTGVNINVGGNSSSSGGSFRGPVRIDRSGVEDSGGESYDSGSYGGDYGYSDGGGSGSSQAYLEAQAAAQAQAARERAERQRNENLRRQNDAKIAKSAREAQQSRKQPTSPSATGLNISDHLDKIAKQELQRAANQRKANRERVNQIAANEVESAAGSRAQERENQKRVRDHVNELARKEVKAASNTRSAKRAEEQKRASQLNKRTEDILESLHEDQRRKNATRNAKNERVAKRNDAMTEAIMDSLHSDQRERENARREVDSHLDELARQELLRNDIARTAERVRQSGQGMQQRDVAERGRLDETLPVIEAEERYRRPELLSEDMADAQEAYARELRSQEGTNVGVVTTPSQSIQDTPWEQGSDVTGLSGDKAMIRRILSDESDRQSLNYDAIKETETGSEGNFDDQREGKFPKPEDVLDRENDEAFVQRKFREARNAIYKRWVNPSLLRIESEKVEKHTEVVKGKKRTYARLRYSDRVEKAIGSVRNLYNCSTYNVMQLVQLRGGIGVDSHGKIANVDPNEFRLTDDQFVELCRDIVESQMRNGNPLGPVRGVPGGSGVRDDTGRYVVVAKTRCFPLGYMPKQLMRDLRRDWNSPLHSMSESQIAKAIGEQWINETYPELCANTGGNLMYQARAIENMMRGLMMIDGIDPSELMIPEVVERQTLMFLRSEEASISDPQIAEAIKIRQEQDKEALSRFVNRSKRKNGTRDANGNIQSAPLKKMANKVDRAFITLTSLRMANRAAHIMIAASGVVEGAVSEAQMSVANMLSNAIFERQNADIAENYRFTDQLKEVSQTQGAIEARSIAEALYRSGGLDMLRAFISELGDDGKQKYKLTKKDFRRFLYDYGYTDSGPISDRLRQKLKINPDQEANFMYAIRSALDSLDNLMLGSGSIFKTREARQFVQMSMAEMGNAAVNKRESYTSSQVLDWALGNDGEALVRSLLQTDAGIEAFMTQGITSLGRKSPIQNTMRAVLGASGVTQYAVRSMFGMFIEYGVNKRLNHIPGSNTISYLSSYGIKNIGDFLEASSGSMPAGGVPNFANAMQRNFDYQVGSRLSFKEGLIKNLRYDMIMAGTEVAKALVVKAILGMLGGLFPPEEEKDKFTLSEWKIGGENGLPIKFAWWTDDLAGLGLPLGFSLQILQQYGWDNSDVMTMATNCFINQVANFNDGTAISNAIDFVTDPRKYMEHFLGTDVTGYDPSFEERSNAFIRKRFWDLAGDMTPAFFGELIPWSKDFLFKGDADQHTTYKYYDENGDIKDVEDYTEATKRIGASRNWLQALFYDMTKNKDVSSYMYANMPLDTWADQMALKLYGDFYIDLDNLPIDQDKRIEYLDGMAEAVIQHIDQNYQNADQAVSQAFALNYAAKRNCRRYCYKMINQIEADFDAKIDGGGIPNDVFYSMLDDAKSQKQHYYDLISEYFGDNSKIPTSVPKYIRQETDMETRYVDDQGNPMNYLDRISGNAHDEMYRYGNIPSILPISSPRRNETTGYNFERIPYWVRLDENGNPISDVGAMYDKAGQLGPITMGSMAGKDLQELQWGGQGNNMFDGVKEELRIPREGVPTTGVRALRIMEDTIPEALKNMSDSELLGIPGEDENNNNGSNGKSSNGNGGSRGYNGYYPRSGGGGGYYYRGGGGGGYSSGGVNYNPRIYSTPKQVYSDRAQGLSVKTPYKATTTYLRPNFYTKGSREAYKRSDI